MPNSGYELTWTAEEIDQQILKIPGLEAKIGDLSTLTTEQKANLVAAINELVDSVATKTKNSNISASFDTTKAYSAGDYVIYEGDLYRAKEDISAGAWDASKWTLISIGEDLAKKANVDGNYEGLTSGYANNLTPMSANDGVVQEAAFISQGTGTGNNLVSVDTSTVAQLLEKSGLTLQIMQIFNSAGCYTSVEGGVTYTNNNNGSWTLNGTATEDNSKSVMVAGRFTSGHTYIATNLVKSPYIKYEKVGSATSAYNVDSFVFTASSTGNFRIWHKNGAVLDNVTITPCIFDITSWPSEIIADLTANPSHFSWYYNGSLAYNPGSLENSTGRYLVCTKRQLWDERPSFTGINTITGQPSSFSNRLTSENFIRVTPNRKYWCERINFYVCEYDKDKNYLGLTKFDSTGYGYSQPDGQVFTVRPDCWFVKFANTGSDAETSYNNDMGVQLYYSPEQGGEGYDQHYPYEEPFVCDTGDEVLKSVPGASDKKIPSGLIESPVDSVDLGTLDWSVVTSNAYANCQSTGLLSVIRIDPTGSNLFTSCSKYTCYASNYAIRDGDKQLYVSGAGYLRVNDLSLSGKTAAEIKAAMSGVILNFERATPTTTQSTPYNPNLTVDDYGMMYWLDTNGNLVSVPQPSKVSYNTDYKGSLDTLIKHANGDMTDVALKSEMEEALSNKASIEDVFTHVTITDPATTLGDVKEMLDEINSNGEHVFFDTYALGANTYVCTILIDADAGIYKMFDVVGQRVTEGTYDADKLLVVVLANLDNIASQKQINNLQEQIDELGGSSLIKDYAVLKQKIADGTSTDAVSPGDKIDINWIDTVTGSTNKGNTVTCSDEWQFAKGVGECEERQYLFVYDGSSWTYNEEQITLSNFGLSVSGTLSTGEVMTITTTVKTVNFTFTGYDKSVPHSSDIHHNWTLEQTYAPDTRIYDTYECLFTLAAGKTLAAGSYKLTNYSHRSGANLTVYFTLSSAVSNTGSSVIQFASLGYVLSGSYYIPSSMRAYQLASDTALTGTITVSMTEISGATDVSTVDGVVLPGSFDFAVFGNNNWALSNVRQYLNDESKTGTYTPSTNFDRPNAANRGKGWLYGIDPRAYDLIIRVDNKFTAGYGNDGYTQNQTYTSTDKIFLLSMKEMSFNINTAEGELLDLYGEYTNNTLTNDAVAARAKYNKAGGTLNSYRWSRSAGVYYAYYDWVVTSSGATGLSGACYALYVAPAFCFGA